MTDMPARGRVLLVEGDAPIRLQCVRALAAAGFHVHAADDGVSALALIATEGVSQFDTVVSDISFSDGLDGIRLLEHVRERDSDVSVILTTLSPTLTSAVRALELGALRYLAKPVEMSELVAAAYDAVRIARGKRAMSAATESSRNNAYGHVDLVKSFSRALDSAWMAYQPIVRTWDRSLFGYEALLRCAEPTIPHPGAFLEAAERLGRLTELGQHARAASMRPMAPAPERGVLFVNLHPRDLADADLFAEDAPLSRVAERVVLEITERSSLGEIKDVRARISMLRQMGFRIALDDLGAGYAGLTSFALLEPEFVKVDMSLVRGIEGSPTKQKLVQTLTTLCKDLGTEVIGEGVETVEERDTLVALGCDYVQGYLLGRPARAFPDFHWGPRGFAPDEARPDPNH